MQACLQMASHGFYDLAHAIIEGASLKISALFCIFAFMAVGFSLLLPLYFTF